MYVNDYKNIKINKLACEDTSGSGLGFTRSLEMVRIVPSFRMAMITTMIVGKRKSHATVKIPKVSVIPSTAVKRK